MEWNDLIYNAYKEYGQTVENIIEKKGYQGDMANIIRLSIPNIIEYYGHQYSDIILNILQNVPIYECNSNQNMYDLVKREEEIKVIELDDGVISEDDYKRASGINWSEPVFDIKDGKANLIGKKGFIGISDSKGILGLSNFIHEFSHKFKSYLNEYSLEEVDGKQVLNARSGVIKTQYDVLINEDKVTLKETSKENIGLEEGINKYDEEEIMGKIFSSDITSVPKECQQYYEQLQQEATQKGSISSGGYTLEKNISQEVYERLGLQDAIRKQQIYGIEGVEQIYDQNSRDENNTWSKLNQNLDSLVKQTYDMFKNIFELDKWQEKNLDKRKGLVEDLYGQIDGYLGCKENSKSEIESKGSKE